MRIQPWSLVVPGLEIYKALPYKRECAVVNPDNLPAVGAAEPEASKYGLAKLVVAVIVAAVILEAVTFAGNVAF